MVGIPLRRVYGYLESEHVPRLLTNLALSEFLEKGRIILRITKDGNASVVLCSGSEESYPADIDFLDGLFDFDIGFCDGLFEGVEVADDVIHFQDAEGVQLLLIRVYVPGQNSWSARQHRVCNDAVDEGGGG